MKKLRPYIALAAIVLGILSVIALPFYVWPQYRVWQQELSGKAELARAAQNRQIKVEAARAEKEAAKETAEAIRIVGEAAAEYPEFREQEFIRAFAEAMENGGIHKVIFVPTERNIPIVTTPVGEAKY